MTLPVTAALLVWVCALDEGLQAMRWERAPCRQVVAGAAPAHGSGMTLVATRLVFLLLLVPGAAWASLPGQVAPLFLPPPPHPTPVCASARSIFPSNFT